MQGGKGEIDRALRKYFSRKRKYVDFNDFGYVTSYLEKCVCNCSHYFGVGGISF